MINVNVFQASKYKAAIFPVAGALIGTALGGPVGLAVGVKVGALAAAAGGTAGKKIILLNIISFSVITNEPQLSRRGIVLSQ